jgi:tetratricopeptide (TPR) repeat protein
MLKNNPGKTILLFSLYLCVYLLAGCAASQRDIIQPLRTYSQDKYNAYGIFIKSLDYERLGNIQAAAFGYRQVVQLDSSAFYVHYLLAKYYLDEGRPEQAHHHIAYIVRRDTTFNYFSFYGSVLYKLNRIEEAIDAYLVAEKLKPNNSRTREVLATLYEKKGELSTSIRYYEALQRNSPDRWYRERLVSLYIKDKQLSKALQRARDLLMEDPAASSVRLNLIMLSELFPNPDSVNTVYNDLISAHPDHMGLRRDMASVLLKLDKLEEAGKIYEYIYNKTPSNLDKKTYGIILAHMKRHEEAEKVLKPIMEEKPDGDIAFNLANGYLAREKYKEAAEYYQRCIMLDSLYTSAWINQGVALIRAESYDSALKVLALTAEKFPDDASPHYLMGIIFGHRKDYDKAIASYQTALGKNPENKEIMFNLASAYERNGNFEQSEKVFKALIILDSLHYRSLNYLGYMYAEKGIRLAEAERYITRALAGEPENGAYLDSYGWVKYKMKKYDEAGRFIQKAIDTHEEDSVIYEHMAIIKHALGDQKKAKFFWKKVLELDPLNEKAKHAIQEIEEGRSPK